MRNSVRQGAVPSLAVGGRESAWGGLRPRIGGSASAWMAAPTIALLLIVVVAVRLHEFLPLLRLLKPALLVTFGGGAILVANSPTAARLRVFRQPVMRLLLAYFGFIVLTVPFAMYPGQAFGVVRYFFPAIVLLMAILLCRPDFRTLERLQAGMVAAGVFYALYTYTSGRISPSGRLSAGMGMYDSNDMAALLALTFPLAVGLVFTRRGLTRIAWALGAVILAMVVIKSGSRGGMLGLGAGAIVLALGLKGRVRFAAVTVLVTTTLALWNFSPTFHTRMSSLANLDEDYNTTMPTGRKEVWKRGRQYIADNPVLGVGAGNFPIAEGEFFKELYQGTRGSKWSAAHNAYVQAYAELGLIGGSLFVSLLGFGVLRGGRLWLGPARAARAAGRRRARLLHRPEFLASLSAYMMSAVFLSHAYFMPLIALLGFIALAHEAARLEAASMSGIVAPAAVPAQPRMRGAAAVGTPRTRGVVPPSGRRRAAV